MVIRSYVSADCPALMQLFYDTVHTVNARDYTPEQLNAWATGVADPDRWDRSLREHHTLVAEENGQILGFGDMDAAGHIDRLYVHRDHQHRGIATAICDRLEDAGETGIFTTFASITARPFFEKRGYRTVQEQQVERNGVLLTNYRMRKIK